MSKHRNLPSYQPPSGGLKTSIFFAICGLAVVATSLVRGVYWAPAAEFFAFVSCLAAVFFAKPARQRPIEASRRMAKFAAVASTCAAFSIGILDQDLGDLGGFVIATFCLVTTIVTGCISELTRNN